MTEILTTLSSMTAQWLEQTLAEAGHATPGIESLDVRPMDGFVGAMGEVGIVSVVYDSDTDLPSEFVAKCPLDNDISRMYASVMLSYQREAGFYEDLAETVTRATGMRIPRCFANLFDPQTHSATLVIERIHPAVKGDILIGCSVDQMRLLVRDLAWLHGAFWMDDALKGFEWLVDWMAPSLRIGIPFTEDSWAQIRQQLPEHHPEEIASLVGDVFLSDVESWMQRFVARPWTLTHHDYELDNVLFRDDGPVIVDWQTSMRSFPGIDLAWFFSASHHEATLEAEPELLELYRHELAAAGGPSWSAEDLADELAWGAFYWVSVSHVPFVHSLAAGETDRGHRRFKKMMTGSVASALRWNSVERIRAIL